MITYRKGLWGFYMLFHYAGTAWPSGILPGLVSAFIGLALSQTRQVDTVIRNPDKFNDNPYPFQLFAFVVGFVMVFRTNFAYQRYWEALDAVQRMGAKWFDGACMSVAFDAPGDVNSPFLVGDKVPDMRLDPSLTGREHEEFLQQITHLFSLLHALALQHLRCDSDLQNLQLEMGSPLVIPEAVKDTAPPVLKPSVGLNAFSDVHIRNNMQLQKLRIVGTLLPEELVLLDNCTRCTCTPTLARVAMVQGWIMRRLIARQKHESRGDMGKTSAPILSRLYQVIADGHMAFNQASKVVTVPFPFPYHNMIRIFLWMYAFTVPFVINSEVRNDYARFILNFVTVWAYFALCEVGDNLEDPFLPYDVNELPLQSIQHSFNARLASLRIVPARKAPKVPVQASAQSQEAATLPIHSIGKSSNLHV